MYKKKFSIIDLYDSGLLKGYLPTLREPKLKEKNTEKGVIKQFGKVDYSNMTNQVLKLITSSGANILEIKKSVGDIKVSVGKKNYATSYNQIVSAIERGKTTLRYVNSYKKELESAIQYSLNEYLIGKEPPKLALRINSLKEIKGMNEIQKRNLIFNVVESILFDDEFGKLQDKLGVKKRGYRINATSNATWATNISWDKLKDKYERRLEK